jgi:hypothetical protein
MQIQHSALPKELIDAGDENSSIIGRSKSSNLPVRDGVYLCELPVGGQDNIITVHYRLIVDILFVERLSLKWICLQCQSVVSGGKCKTAGCPSLSAQFTAELVCHAVDPTGEAVFNVFGPDEVFDLLRLPTGVRKLLKKHAEEEGELVYAERAPWDQQNVASYSGDKNNFGTNNPSHEYDDLYLTNTFDSSSNCNTSSSIAACDKDNDIDDLDDEGGTNNQSRSRRKPCVVELEIFVRKFFPPEKSRTCQLVCRLAEEYGNGGWYAMAERLRPFADRLNGQIYLERTFRVQGVEVKTLCPPRLILTVMTVERLNCVQMADAIWQRRSLG